MFSHDVTKIQTKELSILLSFFFHEVLQHLNTFIYDKFSVPRVLGFAIEDASVTRLLGDAPFVDHFVHTEEYSRISLNGHLGKTDTWSWSLTTLYSLYSSLCEMDITVSSLLYRHLWDRHIESQI